jgi:hypothetical protein
MHLRSCINHGQLMSSINSVSRSHLDGPCAITRTGQFCPVRLYIVFSWQFGRLLLAIITSHASSHPLKNPVPSFRGRYFGPLQLLATLQCP